MRVALHVNEAKPNALALAAQARALLKGQEIVSDDPDVFIAIGGDGTILRLANQTPYPEVPILGINAGELGFLAAVAPEQLSQAITALLSNNYTVEKRLVLEAHGPQGFVGHAVNEVSVHRGTNRSIVGIRVTGINYFAADGLIIATPTGSTAYSLAAGGPILSPDLEALVLTPICAHTISNRPIVFPPIPLEISIEAEHPAEISLDGTTKVPLQQGEKLHIKRSARPFTLVHLSDWDYFSTLRTKLHWTGRLGARG